MAELVDWKADCHFDSFKIPEVAQLILEAPVLLSSSSMRFMGRGPTVNM